MVAESHHQFQRRVIDRIGCIRSREAFDALV